MLDQPGSLGFWNKVEEIHSKELFTIPGKISAADFVDEGQGSVGLEAADQLGLIIFNNRPIARFALTQSLLGLHAAGDVVRDIHISN